MFERSTALWPRFAAVTIACALCLCCLVVSAKHHRGMGSCDPGVVQSSGYIDIPGKQGTQKHYFYWLFGPRRWPADGSQPPVVMWMQGGPGCSSGIALALELGPCMMNESTGNLYYNPYGWNDEAYLLFVDQPAGVGFSYADVLNYDHNESEMAEDMYNFLQGFAEKFTTPSITGANDFHIIGESYAGHYIPALANRIVQGNQRGDGPVINLRSISIGNGWTNMYVQFQYFSVMAYDHCKERLGHPCVNESTRDEQMSMVPHCLELITQCNSFPDDTDASCKEAYRYCSIIEALYRRSGLNTMDITKPAVGELDYDMNHTLRFFNQEALQRELGVAEGLEWNMCNDVVMTMFDNDEFRNTHVFIPPVLAAGIRVVIFAGDLDYCGNWIGIKAWVTELEWPGKAGFNAAPDVEFSVNGRAAGQERAYGNFSFVRIYDAGHMVPMDQPEVALHMVSKILHHERLAQ